jgi:ferredoxin
VRIAVDLGLCEANGICMGLMPDVFDLGDDDVLTVLVPEPAPAAAPLVADAVRQCPRQAISLVD